MGTNIFTTKSTHITSHTHLHSTTNASILTIAWWWWWWWWWWW